MIDQEQLVKAAYVIASQDNNLAFALNARSTSANWIPDRVTDATNISP